jgi:hypothetical protein
VILGDAQREAIAADSRNAQIVPEYGLLGDPDLQVPCPLRPVVGVDRNDLGFEMSVRPNPARSDVAVSWFLPRSGRIQLSVYDVAGRKIDTLVDRDLGPGFHEFSWKPGSVQAGVYYLTIRVGSRIAKKSVVWMR